MKKVAQKEQEQEQKDKRRGLWITFTIHAAVLMLAIFPIVTAMQEPEADAELMVSMAHIQVEPQAQFVVNADRSARKGASNKPPKTKVETPNPEPTPPAPPQPEPAPVETSDLEAPAVASGEAQEAPVQVDDVPQQEPVVDPKPVDNAPAGKPSDTNAPGGNASNNSSASGDGGDDNFLRDGVFGRRVKYRPNIKGLTKEKGRIAVKVCVSQQGTVIAVKFLDQYSTLHDPQLIANALRAAKRYKFDRDYTAPEKQWGKLTFIFDI